MLGTADKRLTAPPPPEPTLPFLEVFQPDLCLVQLCLAHTSGTPELDPAPWLGGSFPHCFTGDSSGSQHAGPSHAGGGSPGQRHPSCCLKSTTVQRAREPPAPTPQFLLPDPPSEEGGEIQHTVWVGWRLSQQYGCSWFDGHSPDCLNACWAGAGGGRTEGREGDKAPAFKPKGLALPALGCRVVGMVGVGLCVLSCSIFARNVSFWGR